MQLVDKYMHFYLDGRGDDLLDDDEIDVDDLAEKAMTGGSDPRKLALDVATTLAAPLRHGRDRRAWVDDNADAIKADNLVEATAFDHYVHGRIDQYAHALEDEIVTAMFENHADEDSGEEDDDDNGDEDDE